MAVTNENSVQYNNAVSDPKVMNETNDWHGRLRIERFTFTQGQFATTPAAGDAGSTARLVLLPAGRCRVFMSLSYLHSSAFGASRTLDIGWKAHTDLDGNAVVADPNGLRAAIDVASAGSKAMTGTIGLGETKQFLSRDEIEIFATVAGGTIPLNATLTGHLVYVKD